VLSIPLLCRPSRREILGSDSGLYEEAATTPETSVNVHEATGRNNPEDSHLHIFASLRISHKSETKLILLRVKVDEAAAVSFPQDL
jgi:hypothetical protein